MPFSQHKIPNPHKDAEHQEVVYGRIDRKVFTYFYRHLFPASHGPRSAFTATFYQRLYEACVAAGIEPVWDESNEERVNTILQRLNFNEPAKVKGKKTK